MAAAEATASMGNSLWDYVDLHRAKSPVFQNFYYLNDETHDMVLRPHSNMANLVVWDYYLEENLAHGPPYDLELVNKESQQKANEMAFAADDQGEQQVRSTMNNCYDSVTLSMPHAFTALLQVG